MGLHWEWGRCWGKCMGEARAKGHGSAHGGGGRGGQKQERWGAHAWALQWALCGGRACWGERRGRLYQPSSLGVAGPFPKPWRPVLGGRGLPWGWCLALERACTRHC